MASSNCRGRATSKRIMRPVAVGLQLLIVNIHVLQEESAQKRSSDGHGNISGVLYEWFQEEQLLEILNGLKPFVMKRLNCPQPRSSKQDHQSNKLKSIKDVEVTYNFKKRFHIPGQHFVVRKSDIYVFCTDKVKKENGNYKSYPVFPETFEIMVRKTLPIKHDGSQLDIVPLHQGRKESKLKDDGTSIYFTEKAGCFQTSSVKRKKKGLRKMAKKSRIALVALPSYQKPESEVVPAQEQHNENLESQNQLGMLNRNCCRHEEKGPKTTTIDLEKAPEGLDDVRKVEDLQEDHLKFLINQMEDYLRIIFRGERYCRRHEDYKKGGRFRDDLNFQVGMAHFSEDQHECILSALVSMFCYRNKKYLDYVTKVMLPEALIKLYQDIHKTSFEQAEECLFNDTILDY